MAGDQGSLHFTDEDYLLRTVRYRLALLHQGHLMAITLQALADACDVPRRRMHALVAQLVELGFPIGTTSGRPAGVFWIVDPDDQAVAERNLLNRTIAQFRRYWRLKKGSLENVFLQIRMELKSYDDTPSES